MFHLRQAEAEDEPTIKTLVREARVNPIGINWRRFVVVEDDFESVIGCAQLKSRNDDSRELASLVVADKWQNQGVARLMIEHYLNTTPPPLWLTCRSGLIPLYEKFGFREIRAFDKMPTYFRRISKLGNVLISFSRRGEYLAVMAWNGLSSL